MPVNFIDNFYYIKAFFHLSKSFYFWMVSRYGASVEKIFSPSKNEMLDDFSAEGQSWG